MTRVAIQGQLGSFHHIVAKRYFGDDITCLCRETFREVFDAIQSREADYAVCAIENTLYGGIADNYDLLLQYRCPIIGEAVEHIHQNLIALSTTKLNDISEVYSHPVALDQCREWLEANLPHAEVVEYHDTAGAVEHVKSLESPYAAAIAGAAAAQLHALPILEKNIEDEKTNLTRFLVLRSDAAVSANANKASLVLITNHSPGALYHALGVFARYNANLTKLMSRPIRGESFKYQFFVDVECDSETLNLIIRDLGKLHCDVTVLGHYTAATM